MSAQIAASLSTTSIPLTTASLADFQIATGYRELAEQAAANAATHAAQAKRFAEQGQSELAHVCHELAQEAARRNEGYAANADFFEKEVLALHPRSERQGRPQREVLLSVARQHVRNDP